MSNEGARNPVPECDMAAYQAFVDSRLSPTMRLEGCALGLCGEAGEVAELVKKAVHHGKDLDLGHLEEELGDVLFYLVALMTQIGSDPCKVTARNRAKLEARYPGGFQLGGGVR